MSVQNGVQPTLQTKAVHVPRLQLKTTALAMTVALIRNLGRSSFVVDHAARRAQTRTTVGNVVTHAMMEPSAKTVPASVPVARVFATMVAPIMTRTARIAGGARTNVHGTRPVKMVNASRSAPPDRHCAKTNVLIYKPTAITVATVGTSANMVKSANLASANQNVISDRHYAKTNALIYKPTAITVATVGTSANMVKNASLASANRNAISDRHFAKTNALI